jgi:hypothetical protein
MTLKASSSFVVTVIITTSTEDYWIESKEMKYRCSVSRWIFLILFQFSSGWNENSHEKCI